MGCGGQIKKRKRVFAWKIQFFHSLRTRTRTKKNLERFFFPSLGRWCGCTRTKNLTEKFFFPSLHGWCGRTHIRTHKKKLEKIFFPLPTRVVRAHAHKKNWRNFFSPITRVVRAHSQTHAQKNLTKKIFSPSLRGWCGRTHTRTHKKI